MTSATRVLDADEQWLIQALPAELGRAFLMVAALDRIDRPASGLASVLVQLRAARSTSPMARVAPGVRLPFLLNLISYLGRQQRGWARDALTAIGAAASARTIREARAQTLVAERAVARGLGVLAGQIAAAA